VYESALVPANGTIVKGIRAVEPVGDTAAAGTMTTRPFPEVSVLLPDPTPAI
jgi:hypothetical protein